MARPLTALAVTAALLLGTAASAYAATGSPPVANPDQVRVRAGDFAIADVIANDKDPDGDQLEVCRVSGVPDDLKALVEEGQLAVLAKPSARGTYTLTYYACDDSYLTAGTLTVVVGPPRQDFQIRPVGSDPYRLKLINTFKHQTFRCTWGPVDSDKVVGRATVRPLKTVTVTIRLEEFDLECEGPRSGYGISVGGEDPEGRLTRW